MVHICQTFDAEQCVNFRDSVAHQLLNIVSICSLNFLRASDTDDSGQTVELSLDMQVRDINDPGILIEPPPTDAGTQGS